MAMTRVLFVALAVWLASPGPVFAQGETIEYYALDAIGSVRVVFDPAGQVLARRDYDPFGREVVSSGNAPNRLFAGLFRDAEAGLDYAEARSYQVRTGRFNAPDPVYAGLFEPQRWNRYSYAFNNPATLSDPTGLCPDCPRFTHPDVTVYPSLLNRPVGAGFYGDAGVYEVDTGPSSTEGGGGGFGDFLLDILDTVLLAEAAGAPELVPSINKPRPPSVVTTVGAAVAAVVISRRWPSFPVARGLPAGIKIPAGNAKAGMEHILRHHGFNTVTTKPASKFAQGMGHIEIRGLINEAARSGAAWRVEGASRVLDVNMGRVIGTDLAGSATSGLRVVTDTAGSVITAYPIRIP